MLWGNYLITERLKKQEYLFVAANNYFWRTYDKKEIDFVEEREGHIYGFEIKWLKKKDKPPREWHQFYTNAFYQVVDSNNYLEFIT